MLKSAFAKLVYTYRFINWTSTVDHFEFGAFLNGCLLTGLFPTDLSLPSFVDLGSALLNFLLPGFTTGFHYRVLIPDANDRF